MTTPSAAPAMQLVLSLMPGIDLFGDDVRTEHYPPGRFDGALPTGRAIAKAVKEALKETRT